MRRTGCALVVMLAGSVAGSFLATRSVVSSVVMSQTELGAHFKRVETSDINQFPEPSKAGATSVGQKVNGLYQKLGDTTPIFVCTGRVVLPQPMPTVAFKVQSGGGNIHRCQNASGIEQAVGFGNIQAFPSGNTATVRVPLIKEFVIGKTFVLTNGTRDHVAAALSGSGQPPAISFTGTGVTHGFDYMIVSY